MLFEAASSTRRRALLQAGFLGALGLSAAGRSVLAESVSGGRAVILLWLWGGPSHLDLFDPKPDAPSEYRGPYRPIGTDVAGMQLTELLPRLGRRARDFALIRSLHHETNDHGLAGAIALTGRTPQAGAVQPSVGSVVQRLHSADAPLGSFVAIGDRLQQGHRLIQGEGGGVLGTVYDPLRVSFDLEKGADVGELRPPEGVELARVARRHLLRQRLAPAPTSVGEATGALDAIYRRAFEMISGGAAGEILRLDREPAGLRDRYGRHRFGQSCLLARRLVESGVPFVQVNWSTHVEAEEDAGDGGWDNHYRNFEMLMERQAIPFDQACSALLDDLRQRGLLESTLVVAAGEFGRTPKINESAGRDHWQSCYSALVAGGGIRGGQVIGASDARGEYPASRPVTPADLCQTMLSSLGVSRTAALEAGLSAPGEPIGELF